MTTWDFIFSARQRCGVTDGMLEIGVFQGKSGLLSARHMSPEEPAFFLDLHEVPAARERIFSVKPKSVHFLKMNSINALRDPELAKKKDSLRWVRTDEKYTEYATCADFQPPRICSRRTG